MRTADHNPHRSGCFTAVARPRGAWPGRGVGGVAGRGAGGVVAMAVGLLAASCAPAPQSAPSAPSAPTTTTPSPVDQAEAVVQVRAEGCRRPARGVGTVIDEGLVLTNAHVVAGSDTITVDGRVGTLRGFDVDRDLALIAVDDATAPNPTPLAAAAAGHTGELIAIDATGTLVRHRFEVRRRVTATGENFYVEDGIEVEVLQVNAPFAQGWSGAPLFAADGSIVGVAFAESRRHADLTYAVADVEIEAFLAEVDQAADGGEVGSRECVA